MATDATRERLLDEAERLFLEKGYDRVSVRAINAAAGMNPAAVHYHFGSREQLVVALLQRRLGPLWAEGVTELGRRRAAGWTPEVVELVTAVVEPFETLVASRDGRIWAHLLARTVLSGRELPFDNEWFRPEPWCDMLAEARPDLGRREIGNRWRLAFDLVLHLYGRPAADPLGDRHPAPPAATVIAFVTAGLDAPAPAVPEPPATDPEIQP